MLLFILGIILSVLIYYNFIKPCHYWEERGVKCIKAWPFIGSLTTSLKLSNFENERYVGYIRCNKPHLFIRDVDLIKQMTSKDAEHFKNNTVFGERKNDPLISTALAAINKENVILSKENLKKLFPTMKKITQEVIKEFPEKNEIQAPQDFENFAASILSASEFNLDEQAGKTFLKMVKLIMKYSCWQKIKYHFKQSFPRFSEVLHVGLFSRRAVEYFSNLLSIRQEQDFDLITSGAEMKQSNLGEVLLVLFSSFSSVPTTCTFLAYELSTNPEIQEKLHAEICKNHKELSYETLMTLPFLDQVVSETLRLWPVKHTTRHFCIKDYVILPKDPEEKSLILRKGTVISAPIFSVHRDPRHFQEPDRFDPERFSAERKSKIKTGTYQPFGYDLQNCFGSDFIMLQLKIWLFYFLERFEITTVAKSEIPIRVHQNGENLQPEKNLILGLKHRDEN